MHESSDEAYRIRNKWFSTINDSSAQEFDNYSFELSSSIINGSLGPLFESLMAQTSDRIFIKDLKGRFVHASDALKRVHKVDNIEGLTDFDFFSREAAQAFREEELDIIRSGRQSKNNVVKETWQDGSETWVSVSKSPLKDSSGVTIGLLGISREITAGATQPHESRQGFALVLALGLMAFVLLLLVSITSLVRVEAVSTAQLKNKIEARSNAHLGLMLALGELQKHAGPDRRVTATAEILDADPVTEQIDGVVNPYWVGVWRTDGLKGEDVGTDFIEYTEGPMTDRRSLGYEKANENLVWLVSGEAPDPTLPVSDSINIFGSSSTTIPAADQVHVSKVSIHEDKGHYAYWVSDNGLKAAVNLRKPNNLTAMAFGDTEAYEQVLSPDSFGLGKLFTNYSFLNGDNFEKLTAMSQLALLDLGTPVVGADATEALELLGHDITLFSYSVLSDSLNGGLKRNMTAYLNGSGTEPALGDYPSLTDNTSILTDASERDIIGPKFGALREWFNLGKLTTGGRENRDIEMTFPNLAADNVVDIAHFTKQPIQPVLIDATYQIDYTFDSATREVYELIYPKVVLWNPYNIKLTIPRLYVFFDYRVDDNYGLSSVDSLGVETVTEVSLNYHGANNSGDRMAFCIPAMTFEPGECLQFTASPTGTMIYNKARQFLGDSDGGINDNLLSAQSDPADLYCFYRKARGNSASGSVQQLPVDYDASNVTLNLYWGSIESSPVNSPTQSVYLYGSRVPGGNPTRSELGSANYPAVQKYYLDHFSRPSNGRWLPGYSRPTPVLPIDQVLASYQPPDSLMGYGMRWRQFFESYSNRSYGVLHEEPWYFSPIIHHNVRARQVHRWHNDNIFGMSYVGASGDAATKLTGALGAHLYSYGPLGQTRQFPEWSDVVNSVALTNGNYRTGPFFNGVDANAISVYPLFDIPDQELGVHSIGAFQHVQFSPHVWHPSYVIGNGFASPFVAPETTGLTNLAERNLWSQKVKQLQFGINDDVHRLYEAGGNPFIYDISFETNYHIWDEYFLSSLSHDKSGVGWNGDEWDIEEPLPNSRMQVRPGVTDAFKYDNLTDFYKAAKYLMVSGGFNVNSTSQRAWEALLRSFNEVSLLLRDGSVSASQFSRFLVPESESNAATLASDRELWAGFRRLSDDEISDLAEKIVIQVKKRAPFIGLGDFVNRRLGVPDGHDDELNFFGTLQAAINQSGVNDELDSDTAISPNDPTEANHLPSAAEAVANYDYSETWDSVGEPLAQEYGAFEHQSTDGADTIRLSEAMGASGYLNQADILQKVGSVITARSDTFTIRAYGDVIDRTSSEVVAAAWCEAVVQRIPEPVSPDPAVNDLNPIEGTQGGMGRKFIVVDVRWLGANEI